MVSMDLPADEGGMSGLFIGKEYIRSKNGEDFVYKEGKTESWKSSQYVQDRPFTVR